MGSAASESQEPIHPLLAARTEKTALVIVLSGDRGLCGAFNTNVNKAAERVWVEKKAAGANVRFVTLGRKGREYLARRNADVMRDFPRVYDGLDLEKARLVARWVVARFEKGEVDSVSLVYNEFKSAITQRVTLEPLLPLASGGQAPAVERAERIGPSDFLYEPNQRALLERLMPMYVEISLYRALLESQASFFGAQMTAMDAATRNAKEMIARLTLSYNRARQAAITKELMEIIGGAEALKG
jgi:F-type H+-transporting ATPase subunit gamma